MSAQIIPFPRKKPLDVHELPDYWPDGIKGLYVQETLHHPHDEVFAYYDERAKSRLQRNAEPSYVRLIRELQCEECGGAPRPDWKAHVKAVLASDE